VGKDHGENGGTFIKIQPVVLRLCRHEILHLSLSDVLHESLRFIVAHFRKKG
jgi:hypothetical protein